MSRFRFPASVTLLLLALTLSRHTAAAAPGQRWATRVDGLAGGGLSAAGDLLAVMVVESWGAPVPPSPGGLGSSPSPVTRSAGRATDPAVLRTHLEVRAAGDGALRHKLAGICHGVLADSGGDVFSDCGGVVARIDAASGATRWKTAVPAALLPGGRHGDELLVVDNRREETGTRTIGGTAVPILEALPSRLHGLDARSGAVRWTLELPSNATAVAPSALHVLVTLDRGVAVVVRQGHRVAWSHEGPVTAAFTDGTAAILVSPAGLTRRRLTDGAVLWQQRGAFGLPAGVRDGVAYSRLIEDAQAKGPVASLVAVDLGTGKFLWRVPPPGNLASEMHLDGESLYVANDAAVTAIDRHTGRQRWQAPPSTAPGAGWPSMVVTSKGLVAAHGAALALLGGR